MTSNKKKVDSVRLGLAIGAILVFLTLIFTAFHGLGFDGAKLVNALSQAEMGGYGLEGLKTVSVSIYDLMTGISSVAPLAVNGLRAAGIILTVAIIIAGLIVFGIISKKFSYKTLKTLAIINAVLLVITGALILLTRHLIAAEVARTYPEFVDFVVEGKEEVNATTETITVDQIKEMLGVDSPVAFVFGYFRLGWGAICAGVTAIIGAFINVAILIYAKKNNLEI